MKEETKSFWYVTKLFVAAIIKSASISFESEERSHDKVLTRLDISEPGWDSDARQARAQGLLRAGMKYSLVCNIYGTETATKAQQHLDEALDVKV